MSEIPRTVLDAIDVSQLPAFPRSLARLMELLDGETSGWCEIAEVIGTDSGLVARVLAAAGSAANRRAHRVSELQHALTLLGRDAVHTIAISASIYQVFHRVACDPQFDLGSYWRHSLGCAAIARGLARQSGYRYPEEAYLAGLMHDIGQLLLSSALPDRYGALRVGLADENALLGLELSHLGTTHCAVGAMVMRRWALDSFVADSAGYHHAPLSHLCDVHPLIRIVALAEALGSGDPPNSVADATMRFLGLHANQLDRVLITAQECVVQVAASLGVDVGAAAGPHSAAPGAAQTDPLALRVAEHSLLASACAPVDRVSGQVNRLLAARMALALVFGVRRSLFLLVDDSGGVLVGARLPGDDWLVDELTVPLHASEAAVASCLRQRGLVTIGQVDAAGASPGISDAMLLRVVDEPCAITVPLCDGGRPVGVMVLAGSTDEIRALLRRSRLLAQFGGAIASAIARADGSDRVAAAPAVPLESARAIVHEVNNPLSIIKNYTASLRRRWTEGDPVVLRDLDVIGEEIDRVARIIRQLAETDPAVAAGQTTDLNVLITTLLPLWERTLFAPNGIRVESHLQAQPARVAADPNSVKQVLLNLVKNAAEAMPAGGVFAITTSSGINRDGVASVAVQIADSGSGIPPEIVARLFSPVETGKAGEHSGLGLSICREILKGLNGSISCRNGERGGACFEILLPQA